MARLYFRFGAMGSSKTANALMVVFNYEEKGLRPLLLKPKIESRDGEQVLRSRIGLERACEFFEDYFLPDINETKKRLEGYDAVFIMQPVLHSLSEFPEVLKEYFRLKVLQVPYRIRL